MHDIAVIGGGVVGASLALMLESRGLDVAVIERGPYPRGSVEAWTPTRGAVTHQDQPHTLLAPVVEALRTELPGVLARILKAGGSLLNELAPDLIGEPSPSDDELVKLGCRRVLLETALHDEMDARGLRPVRRNALALDTDTTGRVTGVVCRDGTVRARLVVDARGTASSPLKGERARVVEKTSSSLKYRTLWMRGPRAARPGYKISHAPFLSLLTFEADDGLLAATLVVSREDPVARALRHETVFRAALSQFPGTGQFAHCQAVGPVLSCDAGGNFWSSSVHVYGPLQPGLLRTGDALVRTNPTFGRGVSLGLNHARRLASSIDTALNNPVAHGVALHRWEQKHLRPWFTAQCRVDHQREAQMAASLAGRAPAAGPSEVDVVYQSLARLATSDRAAARLLAEVKHMKRSFGELRRAAETFDVPVLDQIDQPFPSREQFERTLEPAIRATAYAD